MTWLRGRLRDRRFVGKNLCTAFLMSRDRVNRRSKEAGAEIVRSTILPKIVSLQIAARFSSTGYDLLRRFSPRRWRTTLPVLHT